MLNAKTKKAFKGFKIRKAEEHGGYYSYILDDSDGHTITINLNIPMLGNVTQKELKYHHQFIEIKSFLESLGRW